jgi:tRNA A-37 threonylcarbamoyl transferase component Bud32
LLRLLSAGGEASVFEAEDPRLGRRVAVKLRPLPEDRAQRSSQLQEARALAALSHPLIMQLHDVLELPDALALVLELVRGRDLASLLEATEVTPGMAVHIGLDLCSALAAAHDAGIVHGDLKAANVLVTRDGHLKLFDFGLSRPEGTALPAGSAYGLAPEQLRGQPPDQRTDLFALGCLLYRLLLGEHPFPVGGGDWQQQRLAAVPARPAAMAAGLPTELLDLVFELLAADPMQRPASARALRQRLLTLSRDLPAGEAAALAGLASEVEQARRDRPLASYRAQPTPKPRQRFRFRGLALALVATALLGTALYPRELANSPVAVRIEGVYVTGAASIGVTRLESTLQQLIDRKAGLTLVHGGDAAVIALHVNCASEVCSSQLVWRQGADERSDTRSLLVADSELAWQRRLSQGLTELSP